MQRQGPGLQMGNHYTGIQYRTVAEKLYCRTISPLVKTAFQASACLNQSSPLRSGTLHNLPGKQWCWMRVACLLFSEPVLSISVAPFPCPFAHRLAQSPPACHLPLVLGYFNSGQVVVTAIFKLACAVQKQRQMLVATFFLFDITQLCSGFESRVGTIHTGSAPALHPGAHRPW